MYKRTINEFKTYVLEEKKLTFIQILSLSARICLAIYLPASLILCVFVILNKLI